jgi:hypothetical protein
MNSVAKMPKPWGEYAKFVGVMLCVVALSLLHASWRGWSVQHFMESFMGVFFVVFSGFKFVGYKQFVHGFAMYDIVAKRSIAYAYAYPFLQLLLGMAYLLGSQNVALHLLVLLVSLVSTVGILQTIRNKQQVHCVCLGNIIKLPLSQISLFEDLGMALMAVLMLTT